MGTFWEKVICKLLKPYSKAIIIETIQLTLLYYATIDFLIATNSILTSLVYEIDICLATVIFMF